jgi:hypothetical protein
MREESQKQRQDRQLAANGKIWRGAGHPISSRCRFYAAQSELSALGVCSKEG